jgi:pyrroloquinoline quinone biosynthesis protein B
MCLADNEAEEQKPGSACSTRAAGRPIDCTERHDCHDPSCRNLARTRAGSGLAAAVKILILRGGAEPRRRPAGAVATRKAGASTRERGVMALGNGSGQWVLVNMSPAVAHQLGSDMRLDSHVGLPDADVRAVVLTDAQVDHVGGLLSLREGAPIDLYATPAVFEQLTTALPVLPVLQHYCGVHWHVVPVAGDRRVASFRVNGLPSLEFTALATRSPPPPHLAQADGPQVGDSIALAVRDLSTQQRVFCAPGLAQIGETEFEWMREADCLLLDHQPGDVTAAAGQAAAQDWLQRLSQLPARHKVLFGGEADPGDPARWADRGIALAYDGMEIEL